jgi:hypothetical protein
MSDPTDVDPLVKFWDRSPDIIHAELCDRWRMRGNQPGRSSGTSTSLAPRLEDLLRATVSELNAAEREFIGSLPAKEYPHWRAWLAQSRKMSPEERVETVTGWFVGHVAQGGPDILAGSAAQDHLARLQQRMDSHPTVQARKTARRQLRQILTASLRNVRNTRDRVNARAVLAFYDRLRTRCLAILAKRQPDATKLKALTALPQIRRTSAEALLAAHRAKDRAGLRAILIRATGRAFSRRPTAVRGLMARGRRELRAKQGARRYRYWLAAQGLGEARCRRVLEKYPHLYEKLRLHSVSPRDQT